MTMKRPDPFEFPPKDEPEVPEEEVEPYGFTPEFERIVAATAGTSVGFWPSLEGAVSVDGFRAEAVRLFLSGVAAIAHETGRGPSSVATVFQRLRTMQEDGKVTRDEIRAARQMIVDAFEGDLPSDDEVLGQVVPILRRRMQQSALDLGYRGLVSRTSELEDVEELLGRAKRIGKKARRVGTRVDVAGFEMIRRMSKLKRLPTGIAELDDELKGGMREGEYWLFAGGYKSGKSMALNQIFTHALTNGVASGFATLELSTDLQYARSVGNLTEIPIDDLLDDMMAEGERRLEVLAARGLVGFGTIEHFTPDATTVQDLKAWLLAEEEASGIPIELLVVDYADKMAGASDKEKKDVADKGIAEGLRNLMDRDLHPDLHVRWVVSASQIKGSAHDRKKTKRIEGHHAADSIHKARICDGMWTINPRDEGESNLFFLTANRTGAGGAEVGPLPTEYPYGRCAPTDRADWPF